MRNLVILNQKIIQLPNGTLDFYLDEISKIVAVLTIEGIFIYSFKEIDFMNNFIIDKSFLQKKYSFSKAIGKKIEAASIEHIKLFIYKNEEETFHILLASGEYLSNSVDEPSNITAQSEIILNDLDEESTIVAVKISPNLENIVIIYNNYTLLLLNYEFEILNRTELDDGDGTRDFDMSVLNQADISFRGDGAYFVVNYTIGNGTKTLVRDIKLNVIKGPALADGKIVISTAEGVSNCYSVQCGWQPSGSIIALFNKSNFSIDFIEKNCLRHGEFSIKELFKNKEEIFFDSEIQVEVKKILFSRESCILTLGLEFYKNKNFIKSQIFVFYRSNYDWTLKFSYDYSNLIKDAFFSDTNNLRLFIELYSDNNFSTIHTFDFKLDYCVSLNNNNFRNDPCSVIVVAGSNLKYSHLKYGSIPPPMCHEEIITELTYPYFINTYLNRTYLLTNKSIQIYEESSNKVNKIFHSEILEDFKYGKCMMIKETNISSYILLINTDNNTATNNLIIIELENFITNRKSTFIKINKSTIGKTLALFNSIEKDCLYDKDFFNIIAKVNPIKNTTNNLDNLIEGLGSSSIGQSSSGFQNNMRMLDELEEMRESNSREISNTEIENEILFYSVSINQFGKRSVIYNSLNLLNFTCKEINQICDIQHDPLKISSIFVGGKERIIMLCRNYKLYFEDQFIANEVTSYIIYQKFLLVTQNSNTPYSTLHLIDLTIYDFKSELKPQFDSKLLCIRTIERGSVLVGVSNSTVTLQAIRGNLETFSPRVLILNDIKEFVSNNNYKKAYELVRKHKINMNFLYDCNPEEFLKNIKDVQRGIAKADYLNLMVNGLQNSLCDEIIQVGSNAVNDKGLRQDIKSEEFKRRFIYNKINLVSSYLLKTFEDKDELNMKYLTTILHIYCVKSPPEYLNALLLVKKAENEEADKGLEYLCWIVEPEILYNFALQTYDFELIIMVAKKTQKDPKEFLPYLEKLKLMDTFMMKYTINYDLKNFSNAVIELSKGGDKYFDLVKQTVEKYEMYDICKELYFEFPELKKKILNISAQQLFNKSRFQEASIFAVASENHSLAFSCFYKLGQINNCLEYLMRGVNFKDCLKDIENFEDLICSLISTGVSHKNVGEIEKVLFFISSLQSDLIMKEQKSLLQIDKHFFKNVYERILEAFVIMKKWYNCYLMISQKKEEIVNNFSAMKEMTLEQSLKEKVKLEIDIVKNSLKSSNNVFTEKLNRLLIVQMDKKLNPNLLETYDKDAVFDDNFSETGSVISSSSSHNSHQSNKSKKSNASKLTKKAKNKLNKRNVKEGSPLEEEFLIIILKELRDSFINETYEKELLEFIDLLMIYNNVDDAKEIKNLFSIIKENLNLNFPIYNVYQQEFMNKHPEMKLLFQDILIPSTKKKENKDKEKELKDK